MLDPAVQAQLAALVPPSALLATPEELRLGSFVKILQGRRGPGG